MLRSLLGFSSLLTSSLLFANFAFAQMGTYSEGKRYGLLTKLSKKGWILKSYEGEMMVGNESTEYKVRVCDKDGNCTWKIYNPWSFSVDEGNTDLVAQLKSVEGQYVILTYRQAQVGGWSYNTDYMIEAVARPNPKLKTETCKSTTASGDYSIGTRVGRLVKISNRGTLGKSWEVKIQVGLNGNQFIDMSVTDASMIDCMEAHLGSGKPAKISYRQAYVYNPLNRDTDYDIDKVELIEANPGLEE